jgi:hypothetical protein
MMIFTPNMKDEIIIKNYPGIKKLNSTKPYSSENAEKMSVKELKEIIQKTVLANSSNYEF